jgi:hypothetical protein
MSSKFSQIVDAFVSALSAAPAIAASVERERTRPIADDEVSAINVYWAGSDGNNGTITGAPVDWITQISVECYARSTTLTGLQAIDPIMSAIYARLKANESLSGLVQMIGEPAFSDTNFEAQGARTGSVRMTFPVMHRTTNLILE